jgi:hypothetical protein
MIIVQNYKISIHHRLMWIITTAGLSAGCPNKLENPFLPLLKLRCCRFDNVDSCRLRQSGCSQGVKVAECPSRARTLVLFPQPHFCSDWCNQPTWFRPEPKITTPYAMLATLLCLCTPNKASLGAQYFLEKPSCQKPRSADLCLQLTCVNFC